MGGVTSIFKKALDPLNLFLGEDEEEKGLEPEAPPEPPSPNDDETARAMTEAAYLERKKRSRGKASTILAGGLQDDNITSASRTLLG